METWYKLSTASMRVRTIEVERSTEKTVTLVGGEVTRKDTAWQVIRKEFDAVKSAAIDIAKSEVRTAIEHVLRAQDRLDNAKGLTDPINE